MEDRGYSDGLRDFPLTYTQERLLEREGFEQLPGRLPFHIAAGFDLPGAFDKEILERAAAMIVQRHATLRTTFPDPPQAAESDTPYTTCGWRQRVAEIGPERLNVTDLREMAEPELKPVTQISREMAKPFDCLIAPLMRLTMLRLAGGKPMLLLIASHLIFDQWSIRVFQMELEELYGAILAGRRPLLPALAVQFSDHATWQRDWLSGPDSADSAGYWQRYWERSGGARLEFRDLPFALRLPGRQDVGYGHNAHRVDTNLCSTIRDFALRWRITPYMFFLTGLAILLHGLTNRRILCFWTNQANRTRPGTRHLIGWFVHTHPLGLDLSRDPSVGELTAQVREAVVGAITHQKMPFGFAMAQTGSLPLRTGVRIMVDSIADHGTEASPDSAFPLIPLPCFGRNPPHTLRFTLIDKGTHMNLRATYAASRFRVGAIARLLRTLEEVSCRMIENPDQPVSALKGHIVPLAGL